MDTEATLHEKISATMLSTIPATLTNFGYQEKWQTNTEEEDLGVSLTGIMDNSVINEEKDYQRYYKV